MSEWWSYRLSNFLMFSPQVYHRLFETHNRSWWPLQLLALAFGAAVLLTMLRGGAIAARVATAAMGAAWIFIGWAFFMQRFADIHIGGTWMAAAFALQGLLLLGTAALSPWRFARDAVARSGVVMFAFALLFWPLLAFIEERPWQQAEVFGLVPDPTAIATLGLVLAGQRIAWWLVPIPLLWCVFSGATLWSLGEMHAFLAPALALAALALMLISLQYRNRKS